MGETTKIEWCDKTFNGWIGCTNVGPGCDHCYAEARDIRFSKGIHWGPGAPRHRTSETNWKLPLKWNREAEKLGIRYRVFCSSLADVFDNEVDLTWRIDLFYLVLMTPNLDWLQLTKRIGNVVPMLQESADYLSEYIYAQTKRKNGLSISGKRGIGDRQSGSGLENHEADIRPLDGENKGNAVQESQSGVRQAGELPSSKSNDRRQTSLRIGGSVGLSALQQTNPTGLNHQSQGRQETEQQAHQSGAGDVQRATDSRDQSVGRGTSRCEGVETSENQLNRNAGSGDSKTESGGENGKRSGGSIQNNSKSGISNMPWNDLEACAALLEWIKNWLRGNPPKNVRLGATIVNQPEADRDIHKLLSIPAAGHFLSMEPLLGPVKFNSYSLLSQKCFVCKAEDSLGEPRGTQSHPINCAHRTSFEECDTPGVGIDWVIAGGESGPGARSMQIEWARSLRDQCKVAGVPFFMKQMGGPVKRSMPMIPPDLMIREFPP